MTAPVDGISGRINEKVILRLGLGDEWKESGL